MRLIVLRVKSINQIRVALSKSIISTIENA